MLYNFNYKQDLQVMVGVLFWGSGRGSQIQSKITFLFIIIKTIMAVKKKTALIALISNYLKTHWYIESIT